MVRLWQKGAGGCQNVGRGSNSEWNIVVAPLGATWIELVEKNMIPAWPVEARTCPLRPGDLWFKRHSASGICDSIIRKTAPAFWIMLGRSDDRHARIKKNEEQH
jgi:hypothetical protein